MLGSLYATCDLRRATAEQLAEWLGDPTFEQWTRVTYFSHLRSLCEWLHKSGRRGDDPTAEMRRPKEPKRRPRPFADEEVDAILGAASGPEIAWCHLGLYAGFRVFESAKIRGEHVTQSGLTVIGKGNKEVVLPTHPKLWEIAQAYPRHGYWFPSKRSRSGHANSSAISTRVTALCASVGIDGSTHRFRHTFGTRLLRAGVNIRVVQELMRHESLATTAGYLAVDDSERTAAVQLLAA